MLSFDIQEQIIKKFPVKSMIRFRSVCKAWKSLIDSSRFIVGYNDRHGLLQHLVVRYEVGHEVKYVCFVDDDSFPKQKFALTIPPLVRAKATNLIGISNGLLCLIGYLGETNEDEVAVIWNPSIRKSIVVTMPDVTRKPFNSVLGFGVCPDTKDPKLVKITYIHDIKKMASISSIPCQVMVFTLSSGEWTTSSCTNLPRKSIGFTNSHTVIGRFIYWFAHDRIIEDGRLRFHNLIMSFDLSTQEFREIDLPDSFSDELRSSLSVNRLRDSLVVIEYDDYVVEDLTRKIVCYVWMIEHGDFTKLFTINLPNALVLCTLGFRKSGEPIVEMFDDNRDFDERCSLVVYEPSSEHIKDLGIHGNMYSFSMDSYMESLLLLDHEDDRIVRCGGVKS